MYNEGQTKMDQGLFISPKKIKYVIEDKVIIQSISIVSIISFFFTTFCFFVSYQILLVKHSNIVGLNLIASLLAKSCF
jgi:hypothetical protein